MVAWLRGIARAAAPCAFAILLAACRQAAPPPSENGAPPASASGVVPRDDGGGEAHLEARDLRVTTPSCGPGMNVLGELVNVGDVPVYHPTAVVSAVAADGNERSVGTCDPRAVELAPGERVPCMLFADTLEREPTPLRARPSAVTTAPPEARARRADIEVREVELLQAENLNRNAVYRAVVQNQSDFDASDVQVYIMFDDPRGRLCSAAWPSFYFTRYGGGRGAGGAQIAAREKISFSFEVPATGCSAMRTWTRGYDRGPLDAVDGTAERSAGGALENIVTWATGSGQFRGRQLIGEIVNTSAASLHSPRARVQLVDVEGVVVARAECLTLVERLDPQERAPCRAYFTADPPSVGRQVVVASRAPQDRMRAERLAVVVQRARVAPKPVGSSNYIFELTAKLVLPPGLAADRFGQVDLMVWLYGSKGELVGGDSYLLFRSDIDNDGSIAKTIFSKELPAKVVTIAHLYELREPRRPEDMAAMRQLQEQLERSKKIRK